MDFVWVWFEEKGGENRDDGEGDEEGGGHAHDSGDGDGGEESTFDSGKGEEWDKDENDEDRRVENGGADFRGSGGDDFETVAFRVFAEAAVDVLNIDNGVIDDHADGDGESAKRHGVDSEIEERKDDDGNGERKGNRGERDEGDTEVEKEEKEDECDHDSSVEEGVLEVGEGEVDVVSLTVAHDDLGISGEGFTEVIEGGL